MGAPNAKRIQILEGRYTFTDRRLSGIVAEIDSRLNCAEVYETITRTSDLISLVEIYSDIARTKKVVERSITRTTGSDGVDYITGMVTIFFNSDGSEDSRVTTTITRDGDDRITSCDNVFSTTEPQGC